MKTNTYHRHTSFIDHYEDVYAATVDVLTCVFQETNGEMPRFSGEQGSCFSR